MANVPISALNPGGPVEDTDLFPDVQTVGVGPVKVTGAQIKTYTSDSPNLVTPDIGVATGTSLSLNTSGSYSTKIESSGLATQSWTLVLPPDDGTSGYILSTDGSGNTTWVNPTVIGIDINVNTTAIVSGTNKHLVYDNAGTFGEMSAITTDGAAELTLGTQQTTQGTVVLANTAAGAFSTTIKSSNSATESWALTLPVSKGSNGYILTTDGTGVSAWTNPTALGIDIDVNSTAITSGTSGRIVYDNAGTFGEISAITTNGSNALTIGTQQSSQGSLILSNTAVGSFATTVQSSNSSSSAWTLTLPTTGGTNNYVLTTNGSGVSSWSQVSLTAGVTGTLPVTNGGTGQSTNTIHGVLIGNAANAINATIAGSSGQILQSGGASADPTWTTATFPSTATGVGTILSADGTNWAATTATYPTTTSAGTILVSSSANAVTGSSNPTLGVQQTTQGSLVLANTAAGNFATTIQSSNSASAAWTLTLPTTAGTNGYLLSTNGSGVSSWFNLFGTANSFTASQTFNAATSSIYLGANSGNLGIATLYGSTSGSVQIKPAAAAGTGTIFQLPSSNGTANYALTTDGSGVTSWAQISLTAAVTGTLPVGNGGTGTATALTSGSVVFAGASGVYSQDNSNLFWDNSNKYLGIGTNAPVAQITAFGAADLSYAPCLVNQRLRGTASATSGSSGSGISFQGYYSGTSSAADLAFVAGIKTNAVNGNYDGTLIFGTRTNGSGAGTMERARLNSAGFSIGTTGAPNNFNVFSSSYCGFTIHNGNGGVDGQNIDWFQNGTSWKLRIVNDAYNSSNTAFELIRSGTTIVSQTWYSGATVQAFGIDQTANFVIGSGAIATNATDGFLYITSCAGTPTGVPTAKTGRVPVVYDTTNNKIYVYNGAWKATAALT